VRDKHVVRHRQLLAVESDRAVRVETLEDEVRVASRQLLGRSSKGRLESPVGLTDPCPRQP
jgi:hypothetical protein